MADPFTLVHDAIWDCLEAYSGFTDLVAESNRIDNTGSSRAPNKDIANSADYPWVRILPLGADDPDLRDTSDEGKVTRSYVIQIVTDTVVPGGTDWLGTIYNVEWNCFKALLDWRSYWGPSSSLTIEGEDGEDYNFVTCFSFGSVDQGVTNPTAAEQNKEGVGGWVTVMTLVFNMSFPRAAFIPQA